MTASRNPLSNELIMQYRAYARSAWNDAAQASDPAAQASYIFIAELWEELAAGSPGFTSAGTRRTPTTQGPTLH